ncbi:MAG: hypothetical protein WA369_18100 [Candidatus Acidiferrales bacterium]
MDRSVRVNGEYFEDYSPDAEEGAGEEEGASEGGLAALPGDRDYGPCLYLGPSGQRCSRRALQSGFCALHQPGAKRPASKTSHTKRVAAAIGALGALVPWLIDLLRELFRHLR